MARFECRRPLLSALIAPVLLAGGVGATDPPPAAPPLALETVLAGPETIDLESLAGEAVVIEFWATWCAPCVAAIPHWNELVEAFEGEAVRFLSISDESEKTVRRFLDQRPIAGWLALDADRSAFDAYEVDSIPFTALVDPRGRLLKIVFPDNLTEAAIRDLMASRTPDLPDRGALGEELAVRLDRSGGPKPVFEATIRPSTAEGMMMRMSDDGTFIALSVPVEMAVAMAWETRPTRLVVDTNLPGQLYDLVFETGSAELLDRILKPAIVEAFDLEVAEEARPADVFLLRLPPGGESTLARSPATSPFVRSSPGKMEFTGATVTDLAQNLEGLVGRPVIDATSLTGRYDFTLERIPHPEVATSLRDETGLELVPERREVDMLVLRKRQR